MIKRLRHKWEFDHNKKGKKEQILVIESKKFTYEEIYNNMDRLILSIVKTYPELFTKREEELKEIFENFIIEVVTSKDLGV